jgi:hypothetical protein
MFEHIWDTWAEYRKELSLGNVSWWSISKTKLPFLIPIDDILQHIQDIRQEERRHIPDNIFNQLLLRSTMGAFQ